MPTHFAGEHRPYYAKVLKEDPPASNSTSCPNILQLLDPSTCEEIEREARGDPAGESAKANDTPERHIIFDYFQEARFSPDQAMGRPVLGRPENHPPTRAGKRWLAYLRAHYGARGAWCWRQPEISIMTASSTLPKSLLGGQRPAGPIGLQTERARYIGR